MSGASKSTQRFEEMVSGRITSTPPVPLAVIGTRSFIAEYVPLIELAEIVVAASDVDVPPTTALIVLASTTTTADVAKPLNLFIDSPNLNAREFLNVQHITTSPRNLFRVDLLRNRAPAATTVLAGNVGHSRTIDNLGIAAYVWSLRFIGGRLHGEFDDRTSAEVEGESCDSGQAKSA